MKDQFTETLKRIEDKLNFIIDKHIDNARLDEVQRIHNEAMQPKEEVKEPATTREKRNLKAFNLALKDIKNASNDTNNGCCCDFVTRIGSGKILQIVTVFPKEHEKEIMKIMRSTSRKIAKYMLAKDYPIKDNLLNKQQ